MVLLDRLSTECGVVLKKMEGDFDVRYGFIGLVDDGMCCGHCGSEGTGDDTRLPSLDQDRHDSPGDPGKETDSYRTGCGDPFAVMFFACGPDGSLRNRMAPVTRLTLTELDAATRSLVLFSQLDRMAPIIITEDFTRTEWPG